MRERKNYVISFTTHRRYRHHRHWRICARRPNSYRGLYRGAAEIRAIFGGVFIGMGVATFLLDKSVAYPMFGIIYLAIGLARVPTIFLDKSRESSNLISLATELIFGVLFLL